MSFRTINISRLPVSMNSFGFNKSKSSQLFCNMCLPFLSGGDRCTVITISSFVRIRSFCFMQFNLCAATAARSCFMASIFSISFATKRCKVVSSVIPRVSVGKIFRLLRNFFKARHLDWFPKIKKLSISSVLTGGGV